MYWRQRTLSDFLSQSKSSKLPLMSPWFIFHKSSCINQFLWNHAKSSNSISGFKDSLFIANSPSNKINFQQLSMYGCNAFPRNTISYHTTGGEQIELNYFILSIIIEILKHNKDTSFPLIACSLAAGLLLILKISNIDVEMTVCISVPQANVRNKGIIREGTW